MQTDGPQTAAVLVAEWVLGDVGQRVREGDSVRWNVRPPGEDDELAAAIVIKQQWVEAGQSGVPILVMHADDPEPPLNVSGCVVSIQALRWSHTPDGQVRLLSSPTITDAWIDESVDDYLIQIEGAISPRE